MQYHHFEHIEWRSIEVDMNFIASMIAHVTRRAGSTFSIHRCGFMLPSPILESSFLNRFFGKPCRNRTKYPNTSHSRNTPPSPLPILGRSGEEGYPHAMALLSNISNFFTTLQGTIYFSIRTYKRQLGDDDGHDGEEVDGEVGEVVVGVVGADEEEGDGHGEQELLGGRVLVAVVDLLPHVEVVVGAGVEVEGHALHVVEHEVRAGHVGDVGQRPGRLLRHAREGVEDELGEGDEHDVRDPGSCTGS